MSNVIWELVPNQGIRHDKTEVFFGMDRPSLRLMLQETFGEPQSHMADEDDFETPDGGTLIRLRFDGDKLQDIEFLSGNLHYRGVELHNGTTWGEIEERLSSFGFSFHRPEFLDDGVECPELGINIATRSQVGGDRDDDTIEWVITSVHFSK